MISNINTNSLTSSLIFDLLMDTLRHIQEISQEENFSVKSPAHDCKSPHCVLYHLKTPYKIFRTGFCLLYLTQVFLLQILFSILHSQIRTLIRFHILLIN